MALENSDLLVVQKSGNGELRKTSIQTLLAQGDALWDKDGTKIYPKLNTDSVVIGGSLPNAPAIYLAADGSATFANNKADIQSSTGYTFTSVTGAKSRMNGDGIYQLAADGSTVSVQILADGSASFAGNVDIGNPADAAGYGVRLKPGAGNDPQLYVRTQGSDGQPAVQITNGTTDTVKVFGDGNAEFAGTVKSGGDPSNGANNGTHIKPGGRLLVSNSIESARIFEGYLTGTSTPTISFYPTGSAEFAGAINVPQSVADGDGVNINQNGNIAIRRDDTTSSAFQISKGTGNNNRTIRMLSDGSASFAGDVTFTTTASTSDAGTNAYIWSVPVGDTNGHHLELSKKTKAGSESRILRVERSSGRLEIDNNVLIGGTLPSAPNITLKKDGSATFAGTIQVAGNPNNGGAAGNSIDASGGIKAARTSGTQATFRGYLVGTAAPTITIKADGSADFAGNIKTGDFDSVDTNVRGARIDNVGTLNVQRRASDAVTQNIASYQGTDRRFVVLTRGDVKIGGTGADASNPTIVLNANGSSQYSGTGRFGTTNAGVLIGPNDVGTAEERGRIQIDVPSAASASAKAFAINKGGTQVSGFDADGALKIGGTLPSAPNISLNANGSASLTRIGFKPLSDSDAFIQAINQTTGKIVANHYGNGDITLGSDLVAKSKIRLNGSDGSAEFAGDVQAGGNPFDVASTGTRIYSGGLCQVSAPNTTSPVFRAYQTGSSTITSLIRADGSATFAKDVEVNGVTVGRGGGDRATNTSLGADALQANNAGTQNVACGASALFSNIGGTDNTATGSGALYNNTEGNENVANGRSALFFNTTGDRNVAVGPSALNFSVSGSNGTAIGYRSQYNANDTTTAFIDTNVSVGYESLRGSSTPANNTGLGNTAVGYQSMLDNTSGGENSGSGYQSLTGNTTGNRNTAVGYLALSLNSTGDENTAIGRGAGRIKVDSTPATDLDNCTYLGYDSRATGSNQVQLGNSATTTYAYGAVQDRSDERDKTDVRDTLLGLDFIKSLRPVDFRWDMRDDYFNKETYEVEETRTRQVANAAYTVDGEEPEYIEEEYTETVTKERLVPTTKDGSRSRKRFHHGLIAQEVKAAADAQGVDFAGYQDHSLDGGLDVLSIGYTELLAPLIKAVQDLSAENADLKARLDAAGI